MKDTYKVYLAGPITHMTYQQCVDKRRQIEAIIKNELGPALFEGVSLYSPLRAKDIQPTKIMAATMPHDHDSVSDKFILNRDHYDVKSSDAIFVNLLGAEKVSIGTVSEIAWAYVYKIPTVVVMEPGNVHVHAFILEMASFIAKDLETGAKILKGLLFAVE